jgi:hypothetical protein
LVAAVGVPVCFRKFCSFSNCIHFRHAALTVHTFLRQADRLRYCFTRISPDLVLRSMSNNTKLQRRLFQS